MIFTLKLDMNKQREELVPLFLYLILNRGGLFKKKFKIRKFV